MALLNEMATARNAKEINNVIKKLENIDLNNSAVEACKLIQRLKSLVDDKNSIVNNINVIKSDINSWIYEYSKNLENLATRKSGIPQSIEHYKKKVKVLEAIKDSDKIGGVDNPIYELQDLVLNLLRERKNTSFHADSLSDAFNSKKGVGFDSTDVAEYIQRISNLIDRTAIPKMKNYIHSLTRDFYTVQPSDEEIYKEFPFLKYIDWCLEDIVGSINKMKKYVKNGKPVKMNPEEFTHPNHNDSHGTPKTNDELFQEKVVELDNKLQTSLATFIYLINDNIEEHIKLAKDHITHFSSTSKELKNYDYLSRTSSDSKKQFLNKRKELEDAEEDLNNIISAINVVVKHYNKTHNTNVDSAENVLNVENAEAVKNELVKFLKKNQITPEDFIENYSSIKELNKTMFDVLNYAYGDDKTIDFLRRNFSNFVTKEFNLIKKVLGENAAQLYALCAKKIGYVRVPGSSGYEQNKYLKTAMDILDRTKKIAKLTAQQAKQAKLAEKNAENAEEQEYIKNQNKQFRAETIKRNLEDNPRVYGDDYAYTDDKESDEENMQSRPKSNQNNTLDPVEQEIKELKAMNKISRRKKK